jgi:hypothetical protein
MYNGGILRVQKRVSKGFTFLASYTKAKLIDDSVASPITFGSIEQVLNNNYQDGAYDRQLERSVDPTDIPQRLAISAVYKLPIGAGLQFDPHNRFVNAFIGGWQAQTIVTLQKGNPVLITGANNNLATRPNSTGQSAKLANPTQYEWFNTADLHLRQHRARPAGRAQPGLFQLRLLDKQEHGNQGAPESAAPVGGVQPR